MKRCGGLFKDTFSESNLYAAYLDARKGKRRKRDCFNFETSLGPCIHHVREAVLDGAYRPRPYFTFVVREPKPRLIYAPTFEDTVVQHAIYRVVYPIFDRSFISTSFACRRGYGTHAASRYVQGAMRRSDPDSYTLKLDVRKFFYSIDRGILRTMVERKIKDSRLVDVMMLFAEMDTEKGIPIGNLLSQIYALIYLNTVDHFIKRQLKVALYARYVDDMLLIGLPRATCMDHRISITEYIKDQLGLSLSKSTIQKVRRGVNFVGYRTWRTRRFIRKYSLYKFFREANKENLPAVVSILGHAKGSDSIDYMLRRLRLEWPEILNSLPTWYRRIAVCI